MKYCNFRAKKSYFTKITFILIKRIQKMKKKLNFKQILIILFVLSIISESDTIGFINILFGLFSMLIIS